MPAVDTSRPRAVGWIPALLSLGLACLTQTGCVAPGQPRDNQAIGHRLEPVGDRVLFGIGQDLRTFGTYVETVGDRQDYPVLMNDYVWGPESAAATVDRLYRGYRDAKGQHVKGLDEFETPYAALQLGIQFDCREVVAGKRDGYFQELGRLLREMDRPVYLRPGYECNGSWNKFDDPALFQRAWRRIARIIRKTGGNKVALVWCIAAEGDQDYRKWYPGDRWVDWWAIDLFSPEHLTAAITDAYVSDAAARGFPVMIAECAPRWVGVEDEERAWGVWFEPFFKLLDRHPNIKAFCYINWNWPNHYPPDSKFMKYWGNSQVTANPLLFARWREALTNPRYILGGSREELLGALTKSSP